MRLVEVKQGVLSKNDRLAEKLRVRFQQQQLFVVNLISSPGTGKTALLERTLEEFVKRGRQVAALVGDLATENDANRLARSGAPVRQITTSGLCHLEASFIESRLEGWDLSELEYLFIENVGNLVCPSSFDLGEQLRVVLLSVTEGEDKPLKYPPVFFSSQVAVVTKCDLAEPCDFQAEQALANIRSVNPAIEILQTSARTGAGLSEWLGSLDSRRATWLRSI